MAEKLLEVKKLRTSFFTEYGEVKAVRGIDFEMEKGDSLGIVGESGSGKTATVLSILKLIEEPGSIIDGKIIYKRENLMEKSEKEMMAFRGNEIAMIFQDPTVSLNPVFTIRSQMVETIMRHKDISKRDAVESAKRILANVGIRNPESRMKQYPHEFSVGMKQRVMIAMALSCEPDLIIADEPTSALDVTTQAQILKLIEDKRKQTETSMILITHDLGVVSQVCSKVMIMYGGLIVESGRTRDVLEKPMHPYTRGLISSLPAAGLDRKRKLKVIEGSPPDMTKPGKGCPFSPRCPHAMKICALQMPGHRRTGEERKSMCWLLHEDCPGQASKEFFEEGRR